MLVAILNAEEDDQTPSAPVQIQQVQENINTNNKQTTQPKQVSPGGYTYTTDAKIEIPKME